MDHTPTCADTPENDVTVVCDYVVRGLSCLIRFEKQVHRSQAASEFLTTRKERGTDTSSKTRHVHNTLAMWTLIKVRTLIVKTLSWCERTDER